VNEKQVKTCIKVKHRAYKLFALLDSGSDITMSGRDVADHCGWLLEQRAVAPIKVATDEQVVIDGVATVPLRVGDERSTVTDVLVTRDITGLILRVDWMTQQGPLTWDFQRARVRFGKGEWIDLQKENSRKARRVYVSEDTLLPGSGQTEVDVIRIGMIYHRSEYSRMRRCQLWLVYIRVRA